LCVENHRHEVVVVPLALVPVVLVSGALVQNGVVFVLEQTEVDFVRVGFGVVVVFEYAFLQSAFDVALTHLPADYVVVSVRQDD